MKVSCFLWLCRDLHLTGAFLIQIRYILRCRYNALTLLFLVVLGLESGMVYMVYTLLIEAMQMSQSAERFDQGVIAGGLVSPVCDTVLLRVSLSGRLCMYIYCFGVDNLWSMCTTWKCQIMLGVFCCDEESHPLPPLPQCEARHLRRQDWLLVTCHYRSLLLCPRFSPHSLCVHTCGDWQPFMCKFQVLVGTKLVRLVGSWYASGITICAVVCLPWKIPLHVIISTLCCLQQICATFKRDWMMLAFLHHLESS